MANRIRYVPNRRGVGRLLTSPQMAALMEARARAGLDYAQSIAPEQSGEYKDAFTVDSVRRGGPRGDRAEARLVNTADYADDVERRHRVLGQTVDRIENSGG